MELCAWLIYYIIVEYQGHVLNVKNMIGRTGEQDAASMICQQLESSFCCMVRELF